MTQYQVIEDNGGGLTLAVFNSEGACTYFHTGYEYNPGQLSADLEALKNDENPAEDWEGNVENPHAAYDQLTGYEVGWTVIADIDGIYHERMEGAGQIEFGGVE